MFPFCLKQEFDVTPERHIPRKKRNMKSPEILPPRKDPIPNKDNIRIITQQDSIFPPLVAKWPTGYKPFMDDIHFSNKIEDKHNNSADNSRTEKKDSMNKLNVKNYEDKDDE